MITGLKPYSTMKPSVVESLGSVPEHWECRRLKTILQPVDRRSDTGQQTLLSLRRDHGVVVYAEHFTRPPQAASLTGFKLVEVDELVVNRLQANNGLIFRSGIDGLISPDYSVFRKKHPVQMRFISEVCRTSYYRAQFRKEATGLGTGTAGFLRLYDNRFLDTRVHLPPLPEQRAIVRYLDYVDQRIRRYVCAKRRLIELLEEERQAVVTQAVTRGLDPDVRLKPSSIDWLGDVPEHWELCRLRNVVSVVTTGSRGWSSYASDTGPLFIRVANLSRGSLQLRFHDTVRLNLPETSEVTRTRIQAGDVLVSVTAYIGSIGIAPAALDEAYVSQHVARCQPRPGSSPRWLGYVLLSTVGQTHGRISTSGGTKDGLSLDDVKNYPILLPPVDEQLAIVEHVDKTFVDIDAAIARARRQIELTEEYRTSLVADVVTGKLDVREAAELLPNQEVGDDWPKNGPLADFFDDDDGIPEEPAGDSAIESEVTV